MDETVVCVGALVIRDDAILVVRQAKGHSLEGQWTMPWGRVEEGESPSGAALRETMEEGGVTASIKGLLGVQELPEPWLGWIALLYLCEYQGGNPHPDDNETDAARFLTLQELDDLGEPIEAWSEWFIRRVLRDDYTLTELSEHNPFGPQSGFL